MSENARPQNATAKLLIVIALVLVVAVTVLAKRDTRNETTAESIDAGTAPIAPSAPKEEAAKALPRLVDLGARKCVPCKMMAPILDELRNEYRGRFDVVFIDVWETPTAGKDYGIRVIPTQIFFDSGGKELYRHEGFLSKEDIMAKWEELGVAFGEQPLAEPPTPLEG